MNSAYTVLWSREHRTRLRRSGDEGRPITVLFGGRHLSAPSLVGAGVGPGDVVFPLGVERGRLLVLAGVVVDRYMPLTDYLVDLIGCMPADVEGKSDIALVEMLTSRKQDLGHRLPYGCGIEVALARSSAPLRMDCAVPGDHLNGLRFCPRSGRPNGLKRISDGKLTSALSLQGKVRRLCPDTATYLGDLVGLRNAAELAVAPEPAQPRAHSSSSGLAPAR